MPLLLPSFLFGRYATVDRAVDALARQYARALHDGEPLVEPPLIEVEPGTSMNIAQFIGERGPDWWLTSVNALRGQAGAEYFELAGEEAPEHWPLDFIWQHPWGALGMTVDFPSHVHSELFARRVERALDVAPALAGYRFKAGFDAPRWGLRSPVLDFEQLMQAHLLDELAAWDDDRSGTVHERLAAAIARMRASSDDEARARLLARLEQLRADPETGFAEFVPARISRAEIAARLADAPAELIGMHRAGTQESCSDLTWAFWPDASST